MRAWQLDDLGNPLEKLRLNKIVDVPEPMADQVTVSIKAVGISFPDETDLGIDVLLPDFEFIKSLGDDFLGIFLTHGHEDHIGAIPYFADDINCPIWGTSFTMALLKRKLKENNKEKN